MADREAERDSRVQSTLADLSKGTDQEGSVDQPKAPVGIYGEKGDPYTYTVNPDGSIGAVDSRTGKVSKVTHGAPYDEIVARIASGRLSDLGDNTSHPAPNLYPGRRGLDTVFDEAATKVAPDTMDQKVPDPRARTSSDIPPGTYNHANVPLDVTVEPNGRVVARNRGSGETESFDSGPKYEQVKQWIGSGVLKPISAIEHHIAPYDENPSQTSFDRKVDGVIDRVAGRRVGPDKALV